MSQRLFTAARPVLKLYRPDPGTARLLCPVATERPGPRSLFTLRRRALSTLLPMSLRARSRHTLRVRRVNPDINISRVSSTSPAFSKDPAGNL